MPLFKTFAVTLEQVLRAEVKVKVYTMYLVNFCPEQFSVSLVPFGTYLTHEMFLDKRENQRSRSKADLCIMHVYFLSSDLTLNTLGPIVQMGYDYSSFGIN